MSIKSDDEITLDSSGKRHQLPTRLAFSHRWEWHTCITEWREFYYPDTPRSGIYCDAKL